MALHWHLRHNAAHNCFVCDVACVWAKINACIKSKEGNTHSSNETRTFKKSNHGHILHTLKITNIPQALNGSLTWHASESNVTALHSYYITEKSGNKEKYFDGILSTIQPICHLTTKSQTPQKYHFFASLNRYSKTKRHDIFFFLLFFFLCTRSDISPSPLPLGPFSPLELRVSPVFLAFSPVSGARS